MLQMSSKERVKEGVKLISPPESRFQLEAGFITNSGMENSYRACSEGVVKEILAERNETRR